jgi:hypothetical protein
MGRAARARVLLIRKHGRYEQHGHRVFASFTGRERRWLEELYFRTTEELLAHDFTPLRKGQTVGGQRPQLPRFFVCTHGKHDPCCAQRGRGVAEALDRKRPEATWETSHIGGDRFAGNVLILPHGIYYGRVGAEEAPELMEQLLQGRIDLAHYRGRSCYPFDVQAAEWLARDELVLLGIDDLTLEFIDRPEGGRSVSTFSVHDGRTVEVTVETAPGPPAQLTCHADRPHAPPVHRLVAIDVR